VMVTTIETHRQRFAALGLEFDQRHMGAYTDDGRGFVSITDANVLFSLMHHGVQGEDAFAHIVRYAPGLQYAPNIGDDLRMAIASGRSAFEQADRVFHAEQESRAERENKSGFGFALLIGLAALALGRRNR
jgi:hypothetical protein